MEKITNILYIPLNSLKFLYKKLTANRLRKFAVITPAMLLLTAFPPFAKSSDDGMYPIKRTWLFSDNAYSGQDSDIMSFRLACHCGK